MGTKENINPRVDIVFKKIFGVEENKDLLISLINSIVAEEDQVVDVTLLNPYNPKNFHQDKLSILDIKAKSQDGKRFNIEIQITDEADYDKRALYYWAKLYTEQLKATEDYSTLAKAIGIHILNFTSIPEVKNYHNVFQITEKDSGVRYFKDLELHTIELKKFCPHTREDLTEFIKRVGNALDIWSAFLTRHDLLNKESLPKQLDNPLLKKAIDVVTVMNFTEEERMAYEDHLKWLRIEMNTIKKYEDKGYIEGKAEGEQIGLEKGEQIGLEKGEQIGLEKGQKDAKLQIAHTMKSAGIPLPTIVQCTGLTAVEIENLRSVDEDAT